MVLANKSDVPNDAVTDADLRAFM